MTVFLHGFGALLLLSSLFWCPKNLLLIWVILLGCELVEWVRRHERIRQRQGLLITQDTRHWQWRNIHWERRGQPLVLSQGILIRLDSSERDITENLWIMKDSVSEIAWRKLRQSLYLSEQN